MDRNMKKIMIGFFGTGMLLISGMLHAIVSDDLETGSAVQTEWGNCVGVQGLISTPDCAYAEATAYPNQEYTLTCGAVSFSSSTITLSFLDVTGATLDTNSTEILVDVVGGSYSTVLSSPVGTTTAALTLQATNGSAFQNCTLYSSTPVVVGSIAGEVWFDIDEDGEKEIGEVPIPGIPTSIYIWVRIS